MDLLHIIKTRSTTRRFLDRKIPKSILKQIVDAGRWGPAIHHFQPWRFVVINSDRLMKRLSDTLQDALRKKDIPGFILYPTLLTVSNATAAIFVYNNGDFSAAVKRLREQHVARVHVAEISAIAACVQNMVLVAETLGVGSCWLDAPLFCEEEMSSIAGSAGSLVAVLVLGYAAKKEKRSPRQPIKNVVEYK